MRQHPLTWFFIMLNIAVFLLVFSMPEEMRTKMFDDFSFRPEAPFELWRWLTSIFLHVSPSHLFFNMLGLYFFGKNLEEDVERQWWLSIYFISAFLGSFVFMLTNVENAVGASGAVFGLLGAVMFLNPVKITHIYMFPLPLGITAILFVIVETMAITGIYKAPEMANVANIAHVAGLITGSLFAFFYSAKRSLEGFLVLVICAMLLVVMGPVFLMIASFGSVVLQGIDFVVGFILLGVAKLISPIWT